MVEETKVSSSRTPAVPPARGQGQREEPRYFTGDVTIEVGDERNRSFIWAPTKDLLRGAWRRSNLHQDELVEQIAQLPDIPGMRIQVDGGRRRLLLYDPLSLPDSKILKDEINLVMKYHFATEGDHELSKVFETVTATEIKTWLYWMRRLLIGAPVDPRRVRRRSGGPQARVVSGVMPEMEEILRLTGKIRIMNYTESSIYNRYLEDRNQDKEAQEA